MRTIFIYVDFSVLRELRYPWENVLRKRKSEDVRFYYFFNVCMCIRTPEDRLVESDEHSFLSIVYSLLFFIASCANLLVFERKRKNAYHRSGIIHVSRFKLQTILYSLSIFFLRYK